MKKIMIVIFVLPTICFSQKRSNGYFQIGGDFAISKALKNGFGGSVMAGHDIAQDISFGAGFDMIKYKFDQKQRTSAYGDLRFRFGSNIQKPNLYCTLTPGYSFYNYSFNQGSNFIRYKGGFLIGIGLGCIFYSGKNVAPFLGVMYNKFPTTVSGNNITTSTVSYDAAKISFGIKF
jgi:hypothetical protein